MVNLFGKTVQLFFGDVQWSSCGVACVWQWLVEQIWAPDVYAVPPNVLHSSSALHWISFARFIHSIVPPGNYLGMQGSKQVFQYFSFLC